MGVGEGVTVAVGVGAMVGAVVWVGGRGVETAVCAGVLVA